MDLRRLRSVSGLAAFAASCLLLLGSATALADEPIGFDVSKIYRVPDDGAPARGPDDALVTIVEYSDFHCSACRLANGTLTEILRLYPDEVRLVYRHALLDPEDGTLAAEAALAAADQGRFWPFHDRLFAATGAIDRAEVERAAREVGLDMVRFRRELDRGRFLSAARDADRQASALGVSSTPVFFINGRPLLGAHSLGTFVRVIEQELAVARAVVDSGIPKPQIYRRLTERGLDRAQPTLPGADRVTPPALDAQKIYPVGVGNPALRRGPSDALVTLVEFGDFRCGYCVRVQAVLETLREEYGDKLRLVYRHLPLAGNPSSTLIAEATLAAAEQGAFWPMHDRVFNTPGHLGRPELEQIARDLGLDMDKFKGALDSHRYMDEITFDSAAAAVLGVRGTPTFFINGQPVVGAQDIELFRAVIDARLAEAEALVKKGVPAAEIYRRVTGAKAEQ